jgi:hypothetical protein
MPFHYFAMMFKKTILLFGSILLFLGCSQAERNCSDFKNGEFSFTSIIDGKEVTTKFIRQNELEINYFEKEIDSFSIRWINDCEYVGKNLKPKNRAEEKPIHFKILSTKDNSYTFEYSFLGNAQKQRGMVTKTK